LGVAAGVEGCDVVEPPEAAGGSDASDVEPDPEQPEAASTSMATTTANEERRLREEFMGVIGSFPSSKG